MAADPVPGLVAQRLRDVRGRIAAVCARAGRSEDSVRLVAVSKRIPSSALVEACRAGQWDFGENRVADALDRQDSLPPLLRDAGLDPAPLRWHFIGHLQRNKAAKAAGRFSLLHAVDSPELAKSLAERALAAGRLESVLLQINISGEPQKNGLDPEALPDALAAIAARPGLQVEGLMGMARHGARDTDLAASFGRLRQLAEDGRTATGLALPELSMGMSGDFEIAVAEGATLVRIGGAIFGPRPV